MVSKLVKLQLLSEASYHFVKLNWSTLTTLCEENLNFTIPLANMSASFPFILDEAVARQTYTDRDSIFISAYCSYVKFLMENALRLL